MTNRSASAGATAASQGSSARFRLRTACAELHQRLDDRVSEMLAAGTTNGYGLYLAGTLGLWKAYGDVVDHAALALGLPQQAAQLRQALSTDLVTLAAEGTDSIPICVPKAPVSERDLTLGQAYVLEGSALGAAVLSQRLAAQHPALPRTFLEAQALQDRSRWRTFARALDTPGRNLNQLEAGAREAFERAIHIFRAVCS